MTIEKITEEKKLTVSLCGRLDTTTSPKLEVELNQSISGVEELFRNIYYKWKDLTGNYTIYYMKNGNQESITKEEMLAKQ